MDQQHIVELTQMNFDDEVYLSDIPVLIDLWASWCAPCKKLAPTIESLAEEFFGVIKVAKLNIEVEEELVAEKFSDLFSIPTVVLFKGGQIIDRIIGAFSKQVYKDAIFSELLGEHYAINITEDNFINEVLNSDKPVLLDFWANWCEPCKKIAPIIENIAEKYKHLIKVGKINVDNEMRFVLKEFPFILSIPTVLLIKNGKIEKQLVGALSMEDFESSILLELRNDDGLDSLAAALPINLSNENIENEVFMSDIPVIIECWAEWCKSSNESSEIVKSLASNYYGKFKFCKLNIDHQADLVKNKLIALPGVPSILIYKEGSLVWQMAGTISKNELKTALDQICNNDL